MTTLYLVEGPVGAGKSTYSGRLALAQQATHLDLDEWMVTLFSPDRPDEGFMAWYAECKRRCIEQIWRVACSMLDGQHSVVLELGLVTLADREGFYRRLDVTDYKLEMHVLDVPKAERLRRVQQRNEQQSDTFKMVVTDEVFELADSAWEAPDEVELSQRNITWVNN